MRTTEELKKIFNDLDNNEKAGINFGIFPTKLYDLRFDNHECAKLIEIAQDESGVKY